METPRKKWEMQSNLKQKERQKAGSAPGHRCCGCNARQEPCHVPVCFFTAPSSVPGTQSWPIYWEKKMTLQIQFTLSLQWFDNNKFTL